MPPRRPATTGPAARAALACAAALLLAACVVRQAPPPPPGAGPAWGQAYLAEAGEAFVPDPGGRLLWLGVVSQQLAYDEAVWYCRRLPPHGERPWRVPTVDELKGAPFDRYHLPEEPVRLWSASVIPGELYLRWVVDPRTRARERKEVRQEVRLRVLCVTEAR